MEESKAEQTGSDGIRVGEEGEGQRTKKKEMEKERREAVP